MVKHESFEQTLPAEHARLRTALGLRGGEVQALEWAARGVPGRALLRQAAARGPAAETAALRAVFLGISSGALNCSRE